MFVFAAAVPGLLLVVLGYVVGYAVVDWLDEVTGAGLPRAAAEVSGWITGLVLLAAVAALLVVRPRWLRRLVRGAGRGGGHQK